MASNIVGLDIGATSVRAVEVKNGKRPRIVRAAEVPLAAGVVFAGEVRDSDKLTDAIRALWKIGRFSTRTAVVGIGGPRTMARPMDLPWAKPEEFASTLEARITALDNLPGGVADKQLSYHPLDVFVGPAGVPYQRVLLVGSDTDHVEGITGAVTAAGIKLARADYAPFALIRAAKHFTGDRTPVPDGPAADTAWEAAVAIDLGAHYATLTIHRHGRPLGVRTLPLGFDGVTAALVEQLQIPAEVAERVKDVYGLPSATPFTVTLDRGTAVDEEVARLTPGQVRGAQMIMDALAGQVIAQLRFSIEQFLTDASYITGISQVVLTGGGTTLRGLADRFAAELGAPAVVLTPIADFAATRAGRAAADLDPRAGIAAGLALEVTK